MSLNITSTNSSNATTAFAVLNREPEASYIFRYFLYAAIMFVSLLGNSSVCYITFRDKRMRSFAYLLIANLAASDVLATLCLPFILVYLHTGKWIFGPVLCNLVNPGVTVFSIVTTNTLVAISCDRFRAVVFPFKVRPSTSETRMIIALIWMLAFLFSLPSYGSRMVNPYGHCLEMFSTDPELQQVLLRTYTIFVFLINCLVPLLVILALHTKITLTLKNISLFPESFHLTRTSSLAGHEKGPSRNSRDSMLLKNANAAGALKRQQIESKFIRMLLVVVILFVVCYIPYQALFLVTSYMPEVYDRDPITMYYSTQYFLIMIWLPCAINPIVYAALNERYARAFTRLFCGSFVRLKRLNTGADGSYNPHNGTTAVSLRRRSSNTTANGRSSSSHKKRVSSPTP